MTRIGLFPSQNRRRRGTVACGYCYNDTPQGKRTTQENICLFALSFQIDLADGGADKITSLPKGLQVARDADQQ